MHERRQNGKTIASIRRRELVISLLGICLVAGLGVHPADADVIYTYTGNQFNDLRNGGTCPPTCNITGYFDLAAPLADNMPLTVITPLSFSITSGTVTLTDGEPTDTQLSVGTDSSGAINTWAWEVVGPAASPTARILTEDLPSIEADDLRVGTDPPPLVGPVLGLIQDDPGTWTEVPEPEGLPILGIGLLGIVGAVRGLKMTAWLHAMKW